jgi:hypothetical protein
VGGQDWFLFLEHDQQYELCQAAFEVAGFAISEPLSL